MVEYGFTLWLPTAIKDASSLPIGLVGMLSALPYLASALGIAAVGFSSDRLGERRLHGAIPLIVLAALLYASVHLGSQSFIVLMLFFTLSGFFLFMTLPLITVGGIAATVQYAGLVSPGEYQFNVMLPASLGNGDQPITAMYNGVSTPSGVLITVHN